MNQQRHSDTITVRCADGSRVTYELGRQLGEGTFGQVYLAVRHEEAPSEPAETADAPPDVGESRRLAVDLEAGLPDERPLPKVAIKVVVGRSIREMSALVHEARLLHRIQSRLADDTRIVRILSGPEPLTPDPKHRFVAALVELEYLRGETLETWFRDDWFQRDVSPVEAVREALWIASELLSALKELWEAGSQFAHRDIKPANLMRTESRLRLFDFNVARDNASRMYTYTGTRAYMAPEVMAAAGASDDASYDRRADLYSAGVVVFEALFREDFDHQKHVDVHDGWRLRWPAAAFSTAGTAAYHLEQLLTRLICPADQRLDSPAAALELVETAQRSLQGPMVVTTAPLTLDLIELICELRPSGEAAVVADTDEISEVESYIRRRSQVADPLEDWLEARVRATLESNSGRPLLLMLSGNAGDGKSHLIRRLVTERLDADARRWVRYNPDATHADAPDADRQADLEAFFAPFVDGTPQDRPVSLIAMNTGMAVRFFEEATATQEGRQRFEPLYAVVRRQLGLERGERLALASCDVEVINLDIRSMLHAGEDRLSFAEKMLLRLAPADPDGLTAPLAGACSECPARTVCPVRFNLDALTSAERTDARSTVVEYLRRASLDPEVHLSPRNLWGFWYRILTGGIERYDRQEGESGLCDVVRRHARERNARWLLAGQFMEVIFARSEAGPLWQALHRLDPAFVTARYLDALHTRMGVSPHLDLATDTIEAKLGGDGATLFGLHFDELIHAGESTACNIEPWQRRNAAIRRHAFFDPAAREAARQVGRYSEYEATLAAYDRFTRHEAGVDAPTLTPDDKQHLKALSKRVQEALIRANGQQRGNRTLLNVDQPNARGQARLLVEATQQRLKATFRPQNLLVPDIHVEALRGREALAARLGHSAEAIVLSVNGRRLTVDPLLYEFLCQVCDGQQPSDRDQSRFQALALIGAGLGNMIATGEDVQSMLVRAESGTLYDLRAGDFNDWEVTRVFE